MYDIFPHLTKFNELKDELKNSSLPLTVTGILDAQKIQMTYDLSKEYSWTLYVVSNEEEALKAESDFRNFTDKLWLYPSRDQFFSEVDIKGGIEENDRLTCLRALVEEKSGIVITQADALLDKLPQKGDFFKKSLNISEGMIFDPVVLGKVFSSLGYTRVPEVETFGEYALRGEIVDIYPFTEESPLRIDFFDNEIESIMSFNPDTQRSLQRVSKANVYPAKIFENTAENAGQNAGQNPGQNASESVSILKYLDLNSLIVLDDPVKIKEKATELESELSRYEEEKSKKSGSKSLMYQNNRVVPSNEVFKYLSKRSVLLLSALDDSLKEFGSKKSFTFHSSSPGIYKNSFKLLITDLKNFQKKKYRITLLVPSSLKASKIAEELRNYGIRSYVPDKQEAPLKPGKYEQSTTLKPGEYEQSTVLKPGETEVVTGNLSRGYIFNDEKYVLMTESDMFGPRFKKRRRINFKGEGKFTSLSELHQGDYVVHEQHGIGIYRGIEHIKREGVGKDYIKVEYADGGNLYIPATKLELLHKYATSNSVAPRLNKLNGSSWSKAKASAKKAVKDIAKELVSLYSARLSEKGVKYSPDNIWQKEFEDLFPYEETDDQIKAIQAVKADMESYKVMDRLICGDVGYGKTEIALRAAFKAVQDGKQVAMLAPTTILVQQHLKTFKDRLEKFPVEVAALSRFETPSKNKETLRKLKKGGIDVIIGTHRLLSKDVEFKDLGLLVIDEEQRFGVTHKEKIKRLKTNVDVLSLSATPIPRTLYMSLSGIRDLSILSEPPFDRMRVETYVLEYDDLMAREAILRELKRRGQVFYVWNRINSIGRKCEALRALVPEARIEYAHGQMMENELEDVMYEFVNGRIDVLVSTTIVEAGLDIPNANTLIVDGAERMGLSQLYQLRGRVGRSSRRAYAFLMYRKDKILSEEAEKRLKAIREFTEFGAGVKIAMRDLEIRGAGNVLGAEQHGHLQAIGYELYCKLLNQAVKVARGIKEEEELSFETTVDCSLDAYIPGNYISDEATKLSIYKKISLISDEKDYGKLSDELEDRFGKMPEDVKTLLDISLLKAKAHESYVTEINVRAGNFSMEMHPQAKINVDIIPELIKKESGRLRFVSGSKPRFIFTERKDRYLSVSQTIEEARWVIDELKNKG